MTTKVIMTVNKDTILNHLTLIELSQLMTLLNSVINSEDESVSLERYNEAITLKAFIYDIMSEIIK